MIRDWVKSATANIFCKAGITRVLRPRNVPVVVAYHRVVEDFASSAESSNPSMLVSRRMLEKHLDWIGRRYRFVDLDELGSRLELADDSNARIAAITFDDGYQDFYDHALPMLQRKGIPSAVFVVTDYVGTTRLQLHDKLYLLLKARRHRGPLSAGPGVHVPDVTDLNTYDAMRALLEALPLGKVQNLIAALENETPLDEASMQQFHSMDWETLERIHHCGVTVGSHTRSHVLMPNETEERLTEEVAGSRDEINRRLSGAVRHFAYPSGLYNTTSVKAVAKAGYRFGYTTCSHRSPEHPSLTVPRTPLWQNSSLDSHSSFSGAVLDCQIQHAFAFVAGCRHGHELRQESGR